MSTTHQGKSGGKPRQRTRKADKRGRKSEQEQRPKLDQRHEDRIDPVIDPVIASADVDANVAAAPEDVAVIGEVQPPNLPAVVPANTNPVNIETIANEYRDYTRKSFQESRFFVEKLMQVQSFDKAIEIQSEFARQAYGDFVAESQKICELYSELAKQTFKRWEGFATKLNQPGR